MPISIVLEKARQNGLAVSGLTFHSQDVRPGAVFLR